MDHLVLGISNHIQDSNGRVALPDLLTKLANRHSRHRDIRQNEIDRTPIVGTAIQCFLPARTRQHCVSLAAKNIVREMPNIGLVFDQKNRLSSARHVRALRTWLGRRGSIGEYRQV